MRKYYTIEKTTWTSHPALKKMIATCHCNVTKPDAPKEQTNGRKKLKLQTARNPKNNYAGIA